MNPSAFQQLLDSTLDQIRAGAFRPAFDRLSATLTQLRLSQSNDWWNQVVRPLCNAHPLSDIFVQDPYTRRAREKPRGYAGDAVMLDFVYSRTPPEGTSSVGVQTFERTTGSLAAEGVRWRAGFLAREMDEAADRFGSIRMFALAAGHLRELRHSRAFAEGRIGQIVAMDQDAESLAVVASEYEDSSVITQLGSVRGILKGEVNLHGFHLAYAAGLYDYLPEAQAQALTARLFDTLAPGGKLIVPNFLASNHGRGYMESFMDWHLIVRDREQIERLGDGVQRDGVASSRYFEGPFGVVGYLELTKPG
ncbi:MAG: class I SAM-dependent methyltransferase [Panacagrimonas sp.]